MADAQGSRTEPDRRVRESAATDATEQDRRCTKPVSAGGGHGYGARLGIPEVFVPAGFADTIYDATFELKEDGSDYEAVATTEPTKPASPLPFNIAFWAGPGDETRVLKVASAYEAATHHRRAPPALGPVPRNP